MGIFSNMVVLRRGVFSRAQKIYASSVSSPIKFLSPTTHQCRNNFSSLATVTNNKPPSDQSLVRVIESEIKCSQDSDDFNSVEETPEGFPFKIDDNPGQQTVILSREYCGEAIKAVVHMPSLVTGDEDDDNRDGIEDDTEKAGQSSIPLVVSVSKEGGKCLEFGVTAFPDEVAIDSISVRAPDSSEDQIPYEGPDFTSLDENLQKAFHKYLELRGIRPITTNFLHAYMINKDSRAYLIWLKNLKKFIEK